MKKVLMKYVIWTYVVFFCSIPVIGIALKVTGSEPLFLILKTVAAWIPTFILIVMFRKIFPKGNLKDYIKRQFGERIKLSVVLSVIFLYTAVFLGSLLFSSSLQNTSIITLVNTSWISLLGLFGIDMVSGTTGEELGWRGFLLTELQKKYNPLKSGSIVGVIWGFWHTVFWLVSGYTGLQLIQYIVCFLVTGVAASIITTAFYKLNHNLVIPMITHQLLNFFLGIQTGDFIRMFSITAVLYSVAAIVMIIVNYKKCLYENEKDYIEATIPSCKS